MSCPNAVLLTCGCRLPVSWKVFVVAAVNDREDAAGWAGQEMDSREEQECECRQEWRHSTPWPRGFGCDASSRLRGSRIASREPSRLQLGHQ